MGRISKGGFSMNTESSKKLIRFNQDTIDKIQAYANENFNGNFSMAVRFLCVTAIKNNP